MHNEMANKPKREAGERAMARLLRMQQQEASEAAYARAEKKKLIEDYEELASQHRELTLRVRVHEVCYRPQDPSWSVDDVHGWWQEWWRLMNQRASVLEAMKCLEDDYAELS